MSTTLVAIYGLYDPRSDELRYVGKADDPRKRLQSHLNQASTTALRTHKGSWIRQLKAAGLKPELEVLEWVPQSVWPERERSWIARSRAVGHRLTNGTDGGDGGHSAAAQTPEVRARRAASLRGQKRSSETRTLLSQRAQKRDPACYTGVPPVRRGEANNKAKLVTADVLRIRQAAADGVSNREIAHQFEVTSTTVWNVVTRRTWGHVPSEREAGAHVDQVG